MLASVCGGCADPDQAQYYKHCFLRVLIFLYAVYINIQTPLIFLHLYEHLVNEDEILS